MITTTNQFKRYKIQWLKIKNYQIIFNKNSNYLEPFKLGHATPTTRILPCYYVCWSFENITVAWVSCLWSINSKQKRFICFKLLSKNLKNHFPISLKKRTDFTIIVGDFNTRSTTWWRSRDKIKLRVLIWKH